MYFIAAHFNAQLPVLTLTEAIFQEYISVSCQGWIRCTLLVDSEFVLMKTCYIHSIDNTTKIRYGKYHFMGPLRRNTYSCSTGFNVIPQLNVPLSTITSAVKIKYVNNRFTILSTYSFWVNSSSLSLGASMSLYFRFHDYIKLVDLQFIHVYRAVILLAQSI